MNKLPNKPMSFLEIEEGKMYEWTRFDGIVEYVFVIKKYEIEREDLFGYSRYWFSFLTKKRSDNAMFYLQKRRLQNQL